MKKLILSVAVILGSLSIYASTVNTGSVKIETNMQTVFTLLDSEYEFPPAVILALEETYPGYVIVAAYINEDGEYKLDITLDGNPGTFYIDADGNWIKY